MIGFENLSKRDKYRVARYLYKFGMSPMSDRDYDVLESELNNYNTDIFGSTELVNPFEQSYDDDMGKPEELLNTLLTDEEKNRLNIMEHSGVPVNLDLQHYVSKSMKSCWTLQEVYNWVQQYKDLEFCVSPKVDGNNTLTEFIDGKFNLARTRGRGKNSIDLTEKLNKVLPSTISEKDRFIVASELVVSKKNLERYNSLMEYQGVQCYTNRGAAISILRRSDIPAETIDLLSYFVFRTNYGNYFSDGLSKAEELGFNVVPHEVYKFNYTNYNEFEKEMTDLIWKYKLLMETKGIPTDGIVLQINDNAFFSGTVNNTAFDGGNLAVKAVAWQPSIFISTVKDIIMSSEGGFSYNCKVLVEPCYTEDGKKLSMVNMYNVNTLITNDVHVGSMIQFEYVNETTIKFIRRVS